MPKHSLQTTGGISVSLNALSHTAQKLCVSNNRSLNLHDSLCDTLPNMLVCPLACSHRDQGDLQIGCLTFIAAVGYRLAQLAHNHVAVFCADQAFIVTHRRHIAWRRDDCGVTESNRMARQAGFMLTCPDCHMAKHIVEQTVHASRARSSASSSVPVKPFGLVKHSKQFHVTRAGSVMSYL